MHFIFLYSPIRFTIFICNFYFGKPFINSAGLPANKTENKTTEWYNLFLPFKETDNTLDQFLRNLFQHNVINIQIQIISCFKIISFEIVTRQKCLF